MERISRTSPRLIGRMVGVGYFVLMLAGFDIFYVLRKLIVANNPAATAANLHAHERLFLVGFAVALLGVAAYVVVTALFYVERADRDRLQSSPNQDFRSDPTSHHPRARFKPCHLLPEPEAMRNGKAR